MDFLIPPWRHQLDIFNRFKDAKYHALFHDVGTGKTGTAIYFIRYKSGLEKRLLKTLIFCPPIAVPNWMNEFIKHSIISPNLITPLIGSGRRRLEIFKKKAIEEYMGEIKRHPHIFITNYETLLMGDIREQFLIWAPEILVFDESHKLKNFSASRSQFAEQLANRKNHTPIKYLLTGSPILNNLLDVFYQILIMDGGFTFGTNFYAFRAKYFADRNAHMPKNRHFPNFQIKTKERDGFDAEKEIMQKLSLISSSIKKSDCLDLPPLLKQTYSVEMSPTQAKHYKEMKTDFITFLDGTEDQIDRVATGDMAIIKALRLMQITSGFINASDGETVSFKNTPKDDALIDLLTDLTPNHKVIIWAVWRENYERIGNICNKLHIKHVFCHGDVTPHGQRKSVQEFNENSSVRVFIGHPGSAGIGINLIPASYSIFYSRTFSLEHSIQAEGRNYRGGSEIHAKVTRIDLVCGGTIDEEVVKKLVNKEKIGETVLRQIAKQMGKETI